MSGPQAGPVLVLGATGFVGRHVCSAFLAAGREVVAVSRRAGRVPGAAGARPLALDAAAAGTADLTRLLTDLAPGTVVNAAGAFWGCTPAEMAVSNEVLVERVLDALARAPVRPRLVQLGTLHEYGAAPPGAALDEDAPLRPVSPYGQGKARAATAILAAAASGRVDAVVLRVSNAIGPGMPRQSLLGTVAAALAAAPRAGGRAVLDLYALDAHRDFVDVRDVGGAVVAAADAPVAGKAINIGRGAAIGVREVVARLVATSGVAADVRERPPDRGAGHGGRDRQALDVGRAAELLGWKPRYGLDDSLRALWRAWPREEEATGEVP
ncbi:NAD-dependent epimerase/dehydratase family protein [Actinomadura opuntiae]|uniref:NAD-dependent epimerase/dehydratase family protein n=1 Tax=Actinomadura sp. OS1-43 TaxID=604315 RepID=UPI00255A8D5A|nr:NAD(P)-dependent oxidoreductase [Actinomadura sp. OS1-43]MDL4815424.1 NAD(P)-dependent oxidoreductase [Actinomadura sp. OS1-43]